MSIHEENSNEKKEEPLKKTKDIDIKFDLSDVTENEISLAKKWINDISFDETETKHRNLAVTYPIAICSTWGNYCNSFNADCKNKTTWSGHKSTTAYTSCNLTITDKDDKKIPCYDDRSCKLRSSRMPCRMWLCAMYKFMKTYHPKELAEQRKKYRANKDQIDHEHLWCPNINDITIPVNEMPFIPSKQIRYIRKLIDKHEYRLYYSNQNYGFEHGTDSAWEYKEIPSYEINNYISNASKLNSYFHNGNEKDLEKAQYFFIVKLLTQSLELYKKYVDYIKKCEKHAIHINGNSYYGYISGNDRDEVCNAVKRLASSIYISFDIKTGYIHLNAMEATQQLAEANTSSPWYRPIKYTLFKNNVVYLITGLREFVKAYNSFGNDYSTIIKRQFEHFLKQMRPFTENRFIILAGTQEEINDFLDLDPSFRLLFDKNAQKIPDKSPSELYEIYKTKVEERLHVNLTNKNSDDFKEYITYNRGVFPFKNSTLATYLANYSISKGTVELPTDLSDMKEKDFMKELDSLIGMKDIKDSIKRFYEYVRYKKAAEDHGINLKSANMHMLFTGTPGTGKTTVARIIAKALYDIGIVNENKLIEVERKDLVAEYIGQTAPKTAAVIEKAMNGVLFIDEAYSLTPPNSDKDFGQEAIATLIKAMEDKKDRLVVIFAGYQSEMEQFVESNPGIQSRIGYTFHFDDYNENELFEIFVRKMQASKLVIDEECNDKLKDLFRYFAGAHNIGNGRFVDRLYQIIIQNRAKLNDTDLNHIDLRCIPSIQEVINNLPQKNVFISPEKVSLEERQRVAFHELGHALTSLATGKDNIEKITVAVSANGALGYVRYDSSNDAVLKTETQYRDDICRLLAGLAAEKVVYGNYSNGGGSDLSKALSIAKTMVIKCGMSSLGFSARYLETLSGDDRIYNEIDSILKTEFDRACQILQEKRMAMDALCKKLLKKNVVERTEIKKFFDLNKNVV